jgi:peptidoglycan hydrolase CwlO-like protein
MPDVSLSVVSVVITIVVGIFSAGITWGVMSSKLKTQGKEQEGSDKRIDATVGELKTIVNELKTLTTELQVMKSSNVRNEKDIEDHEQRIKGLEIEMAKLQNVH